VAELPAINIAEAVAEERDLPESRNCSASIRTNWSGVKKAEGNQIPGGVS
jgi:hypothetical protein